MQCASVPHRVVGCSHACARLAIDVAGRSIQPRLTFPGSFRRQRAVRFELVGAVALAQPGAMSTTLNSVLERLRNFGNDKLAELDARADEQKAWLKAAVEEVAQQIAALGPAAKKQRLSDDGSAKATAVEEQVGSPADSAVGA